jgi:hypothetical protein
MKLQCCKVAQYAAKTWLWGATSVAGMPEGINLGSVCNLQKLNGEWFTRRSSPGLVINNTTWCPETFEERNDV